MRRIGSYTREVLPVLGAVCSILSAAIGVRTLLDDIGDPRGWAWSAAFACVLTLAILLHRRRGRLLTQRGSEAGRLQHSTGYIRIFYPIPFCSPPHLRLHDISFGASEEGSSGQCAISDQTALGFTVTLTSPFRHDWWSFRWFASGMRANETKS
jgi:hypothetical protein